MNVNPANYNYDNVWADRDFRDAGAANLYE